MDAFHVALTDAEKACLKDVVRLVIAARLAGKAAVVPEPPGETLRRELGAFVTLTIDGRLRGCIGTLVAHAPLGEDVAANARNAAFRDPRFEPLRSDEFGGVRVEVSVLGEPEPLTFASRADALAQLRPGIDGLILTAGRHRATFLPQVWDHLGDADAFVDALLAKAGLRPGHWPHDLALARYGVRAWAEEP